MAKGNSQKTANGSTLDFEAQLWVTADNGGEESRTLAALLPKLLSGKLRVPELKNQTHALQSYTRA